MGYGKRAWRICIAYGHRSRPGTSRFFIAASTGDVSSLTLEQADKLYTKETNRQNLLALDSRLNEEIKYDLEGKEGVI